MKMVCEWCNAYVDDSQETCPNCGAVNKNFVRVVGGTPKTIDELRKWYSDRNLPPYEVTRFFIGENRSEPKVFGIYQDSKGDFVVYKNKADGSRAVRYAGKDEAYAVNEIYLKLKEEILNQKTRIANGGISSIRSDNRNDVIRSDIKNLIMCAVTICAFPMVFSLFGFITSMTFGLFASTLFGGYYIPSIFLTIGISVWVVLGPIIIKLVTNPKNRTKSKVKEFLVQAGWKVAIIFMFATAITYVINTNYIKHHTARYYNYDNQIYCEYDEKYYKYDTDAGDYTFISRGSVPDEILDNGDSYTWHYSEDAWIGNSFTEFTSSDYYSDNITTYSTYSGSSVYDYDSGSSYSNDSSYDWDSGSSWDSGGSDWDSDW